MTADLTGTSHGPLERGYRPQPRAIWKYPLTQPEQEVEMPYPGIIRAIAWQNGNPTLWVEVDPDGPIHKRRFAVVATGQRFSVNTYDHDAYIGSAISDELVFHVYDARR